jgi:disulfide bond formation protein DsbB
MNRAVAVSRDRTIGGISAASAARLLALLLPLALLAGAYASQYLGGLHPCELCWYQRYAHFAALPFAALAFTAPAASGQSRLLVVLAALAIALSGAIGVYHAGVEAKIFEGLTQCTATVHRGLSNAELLQQITHAPLVRCDEVQFRFLGISMAGWNAILSLGGAAAVVTLCIRSRRA